MFPIKQSFVSFKCKYYKELSNLRLYIHAFIFMIYSFTYLVGLNRSFESSVVWISNQYTCDFMFIVYNTDARFLLVLDHVSCFVDPAIPRTTRLEVLYTVS